MANEQNSSEGATTAQLRDDINNGRTGDKVSGFDPAAAPLGTDDEAGGVSPTPAQIAHARQMETQARPDAPRPNAAEPALTPNAEMKRGSMAMPIIVGIAAAALLAVVLVVSL